MKKIWKPELYIECDENSNTITKIRNSSDSSMKYVFISCKYINFQYKYKRNYYLYKIFVYGRMDSEGLLFWSPEFGVILSRSLAWNIFSCSELLNDETKNPIIRHLIYTTLYDRDFFNLDNYYKYYK